MLLGLPAVNQFGHETTKSTMSNTHELKANGPKTFKTTFYI